MAIRITEDGVVNYENSPDVNRKLFPNLNICGKQIDELSEEIDGKAPAVFSTTSGSMASFSDGADDMPLKSCIVSFEAIQEGEGDPSPENIRPISGRTGLSVARSGKNLLDATTLIQGAIRGSDGTITTSSTRVSTDFIPVKSETIYIASFGSDVEVKSSRCYDANKNAIGESNFGRSNLITTTPDAVYIRLAIGFISGSESISISDVVNPQIEVGSTATDYEAYKQIDTLPVNWETEAGTVYGGTLDVVSGKLTVDRVKETKTWGTVGNATALTNVTRKRWNFEQAAKYINNDAKYDLLCNCIGAYSVSFSLDDIHMYIGNENYAYIYLPTSTDDSTVIELSYTLAEPVEYQLAPQEVSSLLGVNNIWSEDGDVSVDYPVDTKIYIDSFSIKTVEVSGQTPTITAEENTRYICGEVTSLTFTPCEKGICDVRFTAASISTVLTLPETVKLPAWFDPTLLEAGTTYEINVLDGIYGVVMSWA